MANKNTKHETIYDRYGYVYVSGNGRLVVDQHASDEAHLRSPQTRDTSPLYDCRLYLDDVVPKAWLGGCGQFVVTRTVRDDGTVAEVSVSFVPLEEAPLPSVTSS